MVSARIHPRPRARGFGLIEIMVGLVIGFIAVLVIYQVYTVSEGFKRNTTAAGEAQQTGLFSAFMLGIEVGNAGAGMTVASQALAACNDPNPAAPMPMRFASYWRPLPVIVADSGDANKPDTFVVSYSMATTLASAGSSESPGAALFTATPGSAVGDFQVASPGGFHSNDLVVGIVTPGSAVGSTPCATSRVTADPTLTNDVQGDVTITQTPVDPPGGPATPFAGSQSALLNLGPCDRVQKVMYSVQAGAWDNKPTCNLGTSPCTLYSKPLLDTSAASCGKPVDLPANPLAANIVNLKVEYGINTSGNKAQTLDTWVPASGQWSWQTLMDPNTVITQINQIKAVRIGIIVQSEQFDPTLGDYNWVMFDCPAGNNTCPGRLTGKIAAQASPPGNWRFRKYETVIPLRNSIWNRF